MGTWGTNAFEDDTALEIYDEYCESLTDLKQLEPDFDVVLQKNYNMDDMDLLMDGFKEPVKALVAAELVATALGHRTDKFPDNTYHEDMETTPLSFDTLSLTLNEIIIEKAKQALIKIRDTKGIHLTELWLESDSYEDWKQEIHGLLKRLS